MIHVAQIRSLNCVGKKSLWGSRSLARVKLHSRLCQVVRARPTGNRDTGWIPGSLGAQSSLLFSREVVI